MSRRCGNCRWWDPDGAQIATATREVAPQRGIGTCEVDRPQCVVLRSGVVLSVFPTVSEDRVCGRWTALADGPDDGERIDTTVVVPLRPAA
ncbi:MAG TPA: hypothetical protein VM662_00505 [Sphingomonas sp.]|nr:hypothetical protein [Sphingomonas sp.]